MVHTKENRFLHPLLLSSICLNVALLSMWPSRSCDCEFLKASCLETSKNRLVADSLSLRPREQGDSIAFATIQRQLAGASASGSSGNHGSHSYTALIFQFSSLLIGVLILHATSLWEKVPFTMALFVVGMFLAILLEATHLKKHLGLWGESWDLWMAIDPHLLLYTLLPALLAGDAMQIDTVVLKRVLHQVLYLAGPGVAIQAFVVALFFWLYMGSSNWAFELCLVTASILCATDPVAVVALLKDLGASPMLTVLIQGESLCNDGTAIVFFMISYDILSGKSYPFDGLIMFIVKKVLMAVAVGVFIGFGFFYWIRCANNKFSHSSDLIQIALTICCAYCSFIFAEGVLDMSGVLSCVSSSLVLAHYMWPHVTSKHSMVSAWHTIEALGNIIIFFLAGALTGVVITKVDARAWVDAVVIYIVLVIVRTSFLLASQPVLGFLGDKINSREAIVMSWGGLRGAVGLALAIQVHNERAGNRISVDDGRHVLFFVGVIACLTLVVNATTCGFVVGRLGITAMPSEQLRVLKMVFGALTSLASGQFPVEFCRVVGIAPGAESFPPLVAESLQGLMLEVEERIDHLQVIEKKGPKQLARQKTKQLASVESNQGLVEEWREASRAYMERRKREKERKLSHSGSDLELGKLSVFKSLGGHKDLFHVLNHTEDAEAMCDLLLNSETDYGMAKVINATFLSMVEKNYWLLMKEDVLRLESHLAAELLSSVRVAQSRDRVADLVDFDEIRHTMPNKPKVDFKNIWHAFADGDTTNDSNLHVFVHSTPFNVFFFVLIVLNCAAVAVDEACRKTENYDHPMWMTLEVFFTVAFLVEFLLKFADKRLAFFAAVPDCVDFLLVVLGITSIVLHIVTSDQGDLRGAHILRFVRVFRMMRLLRIFRLLSFTLDLAREVCPEVEMHMHVLTAMVCFCNAHLKAQRDLVIFFGGNAKVDEESEKELARCIIQSQVSVFKACQLAAKVEDELGPTVLETLRETVLKKRIADAITKFIDAAHYSHALSDKDAHEVRHPINHYLTDMKSTLINLDRGFVERSDTTVSSHHLSTWSSHSVTFRDRMSFVGSRLKHALSQESTTAPPEVESDRFPDSSFFMVDDASLEDGPSVTSEDTVRSLPGAVEP